MFFLRRYMGPIWADELVTCRQLGVLLNEGVLRAPLPQPS